MISINKGWGRYAFTLIELLIVIAIIALLIIILLPAVRSARDWGQQALCGSRLKGLGQAMTAYCSSYNDWLPGSPNTSGNGANPGGTNITIYPSSEKYIWDPGRDAWPAVHIFDWANPLLLMMNTVIPASVPQRYDLSKRWVFLCPSNSWVAKVNHPSRISIETLVPSYATSKYLTYVPMKAKTGCETGTLFWAHKFVPDDFLPKISRVGDSSIKVFLADSCRIDRSNPRQIRAWLNEDDPENDSPSLSYRFQCGREQSYRHLGGLNMLFYDGHVEHQLEGSSEINNGFGSGSRQARFWFPSGTDSSQIPSAGSFSNRKIIVP